MLAQETPSIHGSAARSGVLELTKVGMQKAYRMVLTVSFVQKLKGWIERIGRDALWDCLSFNRYSGRWSYAWSEMDECGKRSNG